MQQPPQSVVLLFIILVRNEVWRSVAVESGNGYAPPFVAHLTEPISRLEIIHIRVTI